VARLVSRYSHEERERLVGLIYPEEDRHKFTSEPWRGEGFRHFQNPRIVCIEHYRLAHRTIQFRKLC
jgi:hypothetical protein